MIRRLMFHHHIVTRDLKKVYTKQKETDTKGEWYGLILRDFDFSEEDIDED